MVFASTLEEIKDRQDDVGDKQQETSQRKSNVEEKIVNEQNDRNKTWLCPVV